MPHGFCLLEALRNNVRLVWRSGVHGRVQGKKKKQKKMKMNVGPLVNQSISASPSLCTRSIHQIIACLYPHFLLYMTCKFLIGECRVFFWKVGHLHQPFCLFHCAWFMLLHMPVLFFFPSRCCFIVEFVFCPALAMTFCKADGLIFKPSHAASVPSVVLCLFCTVCIWESRFLG